MLNALVNATARQFGRAIVMPNLDPPVTTAAGAEAYRSRILAALGEQDDFKPLMTVYLTDNTKTPDLEAGFKAGVLTAAKFYPAHATTNSALGVTDLRNLYGVFNAMERLKMPLLVHGEVSDPDVDVFDREKAFIDRYLAKLVNAFPALKIVLEHITTEEAVDFVVAAGPNVGATITPHHLSINRNSMFHGGLRPHFYCLPILKREHHRLALRRAATSGNPKFFLGTDSAPHDISTKQNGCACAGIFNADVAMQVYAQVFEEEASLDRLETFAAEHGARFYGLPLNQGRIALEKTGSIVSAEFPAGKSRIVPFKAGSAISWSFVGKVADEHHS
ncbi:dihydroorotase [Bradyrhizobium sp. BR13661]|jgi:dihydroorotase|nr:dihydroorotase [Bradyrhizobium sp. BR13661]